jgi:CRISPR/Cas system-associated endonuclease Cas1
MQATDTLYGRVRNSVITLSGVFARVSVKHGHLVIADGRKGEFVETRFSRADCPISRLIVTTHDGVITAAALRWLDGVGAALIVLDYDGRPIAASVPRRNVRHGARLRRRQPLLRIDAGDGAEIAAELIGAKIAGQAALLRALGMVEAADSIAAGSLPAGRAALLGAEGIASNRYWA